MCTGRVFYKDVERIKCARYKAHGKLDAMRKEAVYTSVLC